MSDDEFDEDAEFEDDEPEEFVDDVVDDDDELDEVLDDDELLDAEEEVAVGLEVIVEPDADDETEEAAEDDDVVDLDEELHPDDVEEALDVVLRERTAKAGLDDEEDEDDEPDDRGGEGTKIVPRRPGEFLCKSCFLVLPRHQLADEERELCHDCA